MINPSKNQQLFIILIFSLYCISLFVNLGLQPLYLEEPRRALIALEMLFNHNLIVPTEFGEFYYKKPPLWNWMIILGYKIFGSYSEYAVRFFTPVSLIATGGVIYNISKKFVDRTFAVYNALFFLISVDIYFYFSMIGEIDIFYSFITFTAIASVLIFYEQRRFNLLFIIFYFLQAIAFLTKGFPTIAFTGITLLVFFLYKRDLKRLVSLNHFLGIFLFLIITSSYFYAYHQFNNPINFFEVLWSASSKRTVAEHRNFFELFGHVFTFPLELLEKILPSSIFLIFAFKKNLFKAIKSNKLIEFSFFIFFGNVIVYWLSPGTRQRYVYMLYPLIISVLTYLFYQYRNEENLGNKVFTSIMYVAVGLPIIICIALPFIPNFQDIPHLIPVSIIFTLLFSLIFYLFISSKLDKVFLFISAFILMRFLFDFTVLPFRAIDSWQQRNKDDAKKIVDIVKNNEVYMHGYRMSRSTIFYIEAGTKKVLSFKDSLNTNDYFIVDNSHLPKSGFKVYYEFQNKSEDLNDKYFLIKR